MLEEDDGILKTDSILNKDGCELLSFCIGFDHNRCELNAPHFQTAMLFGFLFLFLLFSELFVDGVIFPLVYILCFARPSLTLLIYPH
jgi:hypothetical protein